MPDAPQSVGPRASHGIGCRMLVGMQLEMLAALGASCEPVVQQDRQDIEIIQFKIAQFKIPLKAVLPFRRVKKTAQGRTRCGSRPDWASTRTSCSRTCT